MRKILFSILSLGFLFSSNWKNINTNQPTNTLLATQSNSLEKIKVHTQIKLTNIFFIIKNYLSSYNLQQFTNISTKHNYVILHLVTYITKCFFYLFI